jgi:hypothetical protein
MAAHNKSPLLGRIRVWQLLVGLGISGWCTLYSVAVISWGASSTLVGNAQGGCFAVAMTLAGVEAKRRKQETSGPVDPLQWANDIPTEHLNEAITRILQSSNALVEPCRSIENELGFGVRAVNTGRTMVFETARWKEPAIDLDHAQSTEENRKKIYADLAIIVGAGMPDEEARIFVESHPLQMLVGQELKTLLGKNEGRDDT